MTTTSSAIAPLLPRAQRVGGRGSSLALLPLVLTHCFDQRIHLLLGHPLAVRRACEDRELHKKRLVYVPRPLPLLGRVERGRESCLELFRAPPVRLDAAHLFQQRARRLDD